jgi:hypothetical protein
MLKLTLREDSARRSFTTWNVRVRRGDARKNLLFWFRQAPARGLPVWWVDSITEPDHTHGLCTCGAGASLSAASMLHALERGIASAARWIAVELLKNSAPPAEGEKVEGVALWVNPWDVFGKQLRVSHAPLGVYTTSGVAPSYRAWWLDQRLGYFAVEEQALAVLVSHAAPWIAAALAEELKR